MPFDSARELMEQIPSDNVFLKEQWNDKCRQLKDKCADSSEMSSSSDGTSQSSRLSSTESVNQVPTEPSSDKIDQHDDLDTSDLIKAKRSFTHDINMMFEQEMEDEEVEIRKLMYLEPVDMALIIEKIANLKRAVSKHITILDSTKWRSKTNQLVTEYVLFIPTAEDMCTPDELHPQTSQRASSLTTMIEQSSDTSYDAECSINIGYKIKQAFNKLAPIEEKLFGSDEYLVAIRNLLELVVKSRKIVSVLDTGNKVLQREALDCAVSKLSITIRTEHDRRFWQPNLSSLILFLCRHLAELTQPPSGTSPVNVCHYCKLPGHLVAQCPKVELITCFRCFEHGHHKNLCENEEATAVELLANL